MSASPESKKKKTGEDVEGLYYSAYIIGRTWLI